MYKYINDRINRLPFQKIILSSFPVFLLLGAAASADESSPVFGKNDANAFYTEYEVIEDHPECSQTDQVAIDTKVHVTGLSYRIHDLQEGRFADTVTNGVFDGGQCFRIERRGVEVYKYEADCDPTLTARDEPLASLGVRLDFTAEVTSCLSPTGYKLLDGTWSFVARNHQNEVISGGSFGRGDNSVPNTTLEGEKAAAQVRYELFDTESYGWQGQLRDEPEVARLDGATIIEFKFDCIPFSQEGYALSSLYIETDINLLLVDQPLAACSSRICYSGNRYYSTSQQARQCMTEAN